MAEIKLVDPFDNPDFKPSAPAVVNQTSAVSSEGVIKDPFDDPNFSLTAAPKTTQKLLEQKPVEAMEISPGVQAQLGTTDDLQEQAIIFAKNVFPNMPLKDAMSRISRQGDRLVYLDTDGQTKYATPELFRSPVAPGEEGGLQNPINMDRLGQRAIQSISNYSSRLPEEIVTETLDKRFFNLLPTGARQVATGLTQGVAGYPRQIVGNILSDQQNIFKPDFSETLRSISEGGISGAFSQGLERLTGVRNRLNIGRPDARQLRNPAVRNEMQERQAAFEETGVTPTLSQVTNLPSMRITERQLNRQADALPKFKEIYDAQEKQISESANKLINRLGSPDSFDSLRALSQTSQNIIEEAIQTRATEAGKLYKKAFETPTIVDTTGLLDLIEKRMNSVRGPSKVFREGTSETGTIVETGKGRGVQTYRELDTIKNLLFDTVEEVDANGNVSMRLQPVTDLEQLHSIKEQIDARLEDITAKGTSAEKRAAGSLKSVRTILIDALNKSNPNYAEANKKFSELSKPIDDLLDGKIGALAKLNPSKGDFRPDALNFILKAKMISDPASIAKVKKQVLSQPNGDKVWDDSVASWMSGILSDAQEKAPLEMANVSLSRKLRQQLFGSQKQRDAILQAVGASRFKAFETFFKVLESVEKTLPVGSQTATDINADFTSPIAKFFGDALQLKKVVNPGEIIQNISASLNVDRLSSLFTTREGLKELDKFKALGTKGNAAISVLGRILQSLSTGSIREGMEDENQVTRPAVPQ